MDIDKKRKILVTGGCGYIGSHTLVELLDSGRYDAVSVDFCKRSTPRAMQRVEAITGKRVKNYRIDICNRNDFNRIFEENSDIQGIIHFAAYKAVGESVENPLLYYRNNLNSLMNVIEACQHYAIPNLIFSSSCAVYGEVKKLPVNEATPVGAALCPYAHTKQIGEEMIRSALIPNSALQVVILRYFNPVGAHLSGLNGELSPDKPNNLIPIIMLAAAGEIPQMTVFGTDYDTRDGSCIRDYVHVCDIANAHVKALDYLFEHKNQKSCEVFNLGSGKGVSVLEMLQATERVIGRKLNYVLGARRAGDVPAIYGDCSRANELLQWSCRCNIDDMIASAWRWQQHLKSEARISK